MFFSVIILRVLYGKMFYFLITKCTKRHLVAQGRLRPLRTALRAHNSFPEGQFRGGAYLSNARIIFMPFKMSFSDAISINEDERICASEYLSEYSILRVGEGSSVLEIRVGVPHLTKFDVGLRGSTLEGVRLWGCVNA